MGDPSNSCIANNTSEVGLPSKDSTIEGLRSFFSRKERYRKYCRISSARIVHFLINQCYCPEALPLLKKQKQKTQQQHKKFNLALSKSFVLL